METNYLTEQALNDLGEEFAERIRRGENPSIAEYAGRYSADQAEEISDFLDSIAMLEDLKSNASNDQGVRAEEIPEDFGRYRIERSLGEGGMGTVYLAHDSQLDRKVALKTPKFARNSDPNLVNRFYREARSAATLQHPNICPVYDVGEIDGRHYISMAYIEGRPLSDVIRSKNPLPVTSVVRIVRKVALALHDAHSHGLIHRDLKPANIMISRRNEPIVMDFGLARQFDSGVSDEPTAGPTENRPATAPQNVEARLTMDGTIVGSPGYMSPEQLRGEHSRIGPVCDVYALGVLLYELLTRELPFPGDGSLMSVVNAVLSDPPPDASVLRPQLDVQIVGICRKAMAKDAADRYESMLEFSAALTSFLNSKATLADANQPKSKRRTNRPWGYAIIAAVFTIGMFVLAQMLTGDSAIDATASSPTGLASSVADVAKSEAVESVHVAEAAPDPTSEDETDAAQETRLGRFNPDRILPAERLQRLDVNNDGRITKQELDIPRIPPGGVLRRAIEEFDRFDTSPQDGALDRFEIQRLLRLLTRSGLGENGMRPRRGP